MSSERQTGADVHIERSTGFRDIRVSRQWCVNRLDGRIRKGGRKSGDPVVHLALSACYRYAPLDHLWSSGLNWQRLAQRYCASPQQFSPAIGKFCSTQMDIPIQQGGATHSKDSFPSMVFRNVNSVFSTNIAMYIWPDDPWDSMPTISALRIGAEDTWASTWYIPLVW